jgi:hypothetical protein
MGVEQSAYGSIRSEGFSKAVYFHHQRGSAVSAIEAARRSVNRYNESQYRHQARVNLAAHRSL